MLIECYYELDANKASGVDYLTKQKYEKNLHGNVDDLLDRMKRQAYKPQPARRVYIEKENGKERALGIPVYEDKLVQKALSKILNAIFEEDFLECSFVFRPERSCHDVLRVLDKVISKDKI